MLNTNETSTSDQMTAATMAAGSLFSLAGLTPINPLSMIDFTHSGSAIEAEAKLVDYRGEKVAGFEIDGDTMICLPQAYEMFLKNLVGGLHTVYTKLKRLEIVPRVCNVEQVRALRSLGAIQPGVNRCKLIACKDFDVLYEDCTSTNSRPGRPPKRSPVSGASGPLDAAPWNAFFKRPKLDAGDTKNFTTGMLAAASGNVGMAGATQSPPSGLMSANAAAAGLLSPFSAAAAQQFMMQHMMLQHAARQAVVNGNRDDDSPDCASQSKPSLWMAAMQDDETNRPLNLSKSDESTQALVNQNQAEDQQSSVGDAAEEDLQIADVDATEEGNAARSDTADSDAGAMADVSWMNGNHNAVTAPIGEQATAPKLNHNYPSIQALLLNVHGMIELAVATARTLEQQRNAEKAEIMNQLAQERREKCQLQKMLNIERKLKKNNDEKDSTQERDVDNNTPERETSPNPQSDNNNCDDAAPVTNGH